MKKLLLMALAVAGTAFIANPGHADDGDPLDCGRDYYKKCKTECDDRNRSEKAAVKAHKAWGECADKSSNDGTNADEICDYQSVNDWRAVAMEYDRLLQVCMDGGDDEDVFL